MDEYLIKLHKNAGIKCGEKLTCGKKVDYKSEETAMKVAIKMSEKYGDEKEAYPCPFCNGWHIGRKMYLEELEKYEEQIKRKDD